MNKTVVCSFYVDRRREFSKRGALKQFADEPPDYIAMLKILDASCARLGLDHVVLTDAATSPEVEDAGLRAFFADLPDSLMKATTEIQARWLESPYSKGVDSVFVGADCIVRREFRGALPACDFAIVFMKGHKRWRLNNGFMFVPDKSRERMAPIFRLIADDTGERMCDDMLAIERALSPMPKEYGVHRRRQVDVAFLAVNEWNRGFEIDVADPAEDAFIMHFMGDWRGGKKRFFDWAAKHGFAEC